MLGTFPHSSPWQPAGGAESTPSTDPQVRPRNPRMKTVGHSPSRCEHVRVRACVTWSCPALCDPMDCSPPGSSAHGISQAGILQWAPFSSPGDLPNPRNLHFLSWCSSPLSHSEARGLQRSLPEITVPFNFADVATSRAQMRVWQIAFAWLDGTFQPLHWTRNL